MIIHRRFLLGALAGTGLAATAVQPAAAGEEISIFAAGAMQKPVEALIALFARLSPDHKVAATYDTVGGLADRIVAGDSPDLVFLSENALKQLAEKGKLARNQVSPIGRTGVGLCAPLSAPQIDISTPDKLRAALLAAPSIVHADPARGATAGTHFRKVLSEMGILDQIAPRITVVPFGGEIPGRVAKGEFALGASQSSEIVPVKDVRYLGHLPVPYALWTTYGLASVKGLRLPDSAAAEFALLVFTVEGDAIFKQAGFETQMR